jgi:hypothetical protein
MLTGRCRKGELEHIPLSSGLIIGARRLSSGIRFLEDWGLLLSLLLFLVRGLEVEDGWVWVWV